MKKWIVDHKWVRIICLLGLVSLLSGYVLLGKMKTTPFHGDESGWISAGYYYTDLLLNHDFDWAKWRCAQCGDWGSSLTMPLGKWMIGVS